MGLKSVPASPFGPGGPAGPMRKKRERNYNYLKVQTFHFDSLL